MKKRRKKERITWEKNLIKKTVKKEITKYKHKRMIEKKETKRRKKKE